MPDIRLLEPADASALDAFLREHAAQTMILRSNLARSGIVDGAEPYQGRYAAVFESGRITGVAAFYWNGMLVLCAGKQAPVVAQTAVAGRRVSGILGPWQEALDIQEVLGLNSEYCRLRSREMLMTLDIGKLRQPAALPNQQLVFRTATPADLDLLAAWRMEFALETLGATPSEALSRYCRVEVEHWVREESQFLLFDGDRPVSGCCFNARLPDAVQIGNVWTPPDFRSRRYGRMVVAEALGLAHEQGASLSVLFTPVDNQAAQTAYLALGFSAIGEYAMLLFR